jgi:hypothetical protein
VLASRPYRIELSEVNRGVFSGTAKYRGKRALASGHIMMFSLAMPVGARLGTVTLTSFQESR